MTDVVLTPTPDLCDQHADKVRVVDPIFKNFGGKKAFMGEIATVKCFEDNSCVRQILAKPGEGRVLVVDGGGSMRRACLGDVLCGMAVNHSWRGILVYGCIRDIDAIAQMNLGVQALGVHPMKTEKKSVGEIDVPVNFGGVTFSPGDTLYADNNGIVVSSWPLSPN
jgi:regulator of ribonuclease activity A